MGLHIPVQDQVIGGTSHVPMPSLEEFPAVLTDLAALTSEAILRLQFICKHGVRSSALIVLPAVKRNFPDENGVD